MCGRLSDCCQLIEAVNYSCGTGCEEWEAAAYFQQRFRLDRAALLRLYQLSYCLCSNNGNGALVTVSATRGDVEQRSDRSNDPTILGA
jgi:hypothetical protein